MLLDPAGIVLCFLIAMTVVMGMANGKIKRPQLYFFPALIGFYLIGAFINLNSKWVGTRSSDTARSRTT